MVTVTSTVKVSGTSEITLSFDTRTEALLAQTGSSKFIQIGDLRYTYDPSGTALTTGDGRTWKPQGVTMAEHYGASGDGVTNDGAALKAAAASGADVVLTKGRTYLMDGATIICATDFQKFYGGGRLKKTSGDFDPDDTSIGGDDKAKFFRVTGLEGVEVTDLEFEYTLAAESPRVYGVVVEGLVEGAAVTAKAVGTKINNNRFIGNETPVFLFAGADQTDFCGNTCEGGVFGIATGFDGANQYAPITNTRIIANTIRGVLGDSIDINFDTQGCLIKDNVLLNNGTGSAEEDIDIGGGECFDIVVEGNLIDSGGLQKRGITVKLNTYNVVVRDNIVRNCKVAETDSALIYVNGATEAIAAHNILIEGNQGSGAYYGVYLLQAPRDVTVLNNDLDVTGYGVRQVNQHPTEGNATDYLVGGNRIRRTGGTLIGSGIDMAYVDGVSVFDNEISGATAFGVLLNSNCTEGNIKGNVVELCATGINCIAPRSQIVGNKVTACTSHGISINADHIIARGNQCWDNSTGGAGARGILLTAGSDFAVITGNQSWDTRGTKLQLGLGITGACDRCIITVNMLYDNSTNLAGTGSLTNSVVADNITA